MPPAGRQRFAKTPSTRAKIKFPDDVSRKAHLAATLWFGRFAMDWLVRAESSNRLQGGISYREQTARAVDAIAFRARGRSAKDLKLLPLSDDYGPLASCVDHPAV